MNAEIDIAQCMAHCRPNAQWNLNGNTLGGLQMLDGSSPPTLEELEDAWAAMTPMLGWPSVQQFMAAFTDAELATIASSDNAMVKGLTFKLSGWRDRVLADDTRIQQGLNLLVQLGLISAERKTEIITTATPL